MNEAAHIGPLLAGLLRDMDPRVVEIIVADGASTDGTQGIVQGVAACDERVRLIGNPARIQSAGVNRAAQAADPASDVLLRLDAHARYPADFTQACLDALAQSGADSVVVRLHSVGETCFQRAVAAAGNSRLGTGGAAHRVGAASGFIDHGHHAALRREAFARLGGYDEAFAANEDAEFDQRLTAGGGRIWLAADIVVDYRPRATPAALARQYFGYGAGRAQRLRKHGGPLRARQLAPLMLLAMLGASLIGAAASPWLLIPAAGYGLVVLAAAGGMALTSRRACALGTILALPIMHLAWAAGFLAGLGRRP